MPSCRLRNTRSCGAAREEAGRGGAGRARPRWVGASKLRALVKGWGTHARSTAGAEHASGHARAHQHDHQAPDAACQAALLTRQEPNPAQAHRAHRAHQAQPPLKGHAPLSPAHAQSRPAPLPAGRAAGTAASCRASRPRPRTAAPGSCARGAAGRPRRACGGCVHEWGGREACVRGSSIRTTCAGKGPMLAKRSWAFRHGPSRLGGTGCKAAAAGLGSGAGQR